VYIVVLLLGLLKKRKNGKKRLKMEKNGKKRDIWVKSVFFQKPDSEK
jgi:hypothetical protein